MGETLSSQKDESGDRKWGPWPWATCVIGSEQSCLFITSEQSIAFLVCCLIGLILNLQSFPLKASSSCPPEKILLKLPSSLLRHSESQSNNDTLNHREYEHRNLRLLRFYRQSHELENTARERSHTSLEASQITSGELQPTPPPGRTAN